ncbi:hypothetical protein [Streptomyces sp. NPDC020681]|uniref:hypothetical protein n=1 Tax=Streptomyces sp. NPDC020681 TaxID=3365083 RepID=UPI0037AF54B4
MTVEQPTPQRPHSRRTDRFVAPHAFVMVDPGRPPDLSQWAPGSVEALIIDVLTCAACHGLEAALTAAGTLLGVARECLDAQVWLRLHPADRLVASGYLEVAARLAELVGQADGVVLPEVRSAADVGEVLALLDPTAATAVMPVVDTDAPLTDIERLANHPGVVRLAAATRTGRVKLSLVSQVHGLAAPVNAVTANSTDACDLIHDAVLARCDGFGGQCVPSAELAADVRALYRDRGRD